MQIYTVIVLCFTIWMLVDALRRRAPLHWFVIVLLFAPLGGVIYFFMVKRRDFKPSWPGLGSGGAAPLEQLRELVEHNPSYEHRARLAAALERHGDYARAADLFAELHREEPRPEVQLGLARSLVGVGRLKEGIEQYQRLLEQDQATANYSAALEYGEALFRNGDKEDALELLRGLVQHTGRANHRVALAHYLREAGELEAARLELQGLLADLEAASKAERFRVAKWERLARQMLEDLTEVAEKPPTPPDPTLH